MVLGRRRHARPARRRPRRAADPGWQRRVASARRRLSVVLHHDAPAHTATRRTVVPARPRRPGVHRRPPDRRVRGAARGRRAVGRVDARAPHARQPGGCGPGDTTGDPDVRARVRRAPDPRAARTAAVVLVPDRDRQRRQEARVPRPRRHRHGAHQRRRGHARPVSPGRHRGQLAGVAQVPDRDRRAAVGVR
jgi:hypothetical protein